MWLTHEGPPRGFKRGQGKALRVHQVPRGQRKLSLKGAVDRESDTNDISSFHLSRASNKNLICLQFP